MGTPRLTALGTLFLVAVSIASIAVAFNIAVLVTVFTDWPGYAYDLLAFVIAGFAGGFGYRLIISVAE